MKKVNLALCLMSFSSLLMAQTKTLPTKTVKPSLQKPTQQSFGVFKTKTVVIEKRVNGKIQDKILFVPDEKKSKALLRNFGGQEGNGGDMCELRLKDIRTDIEGWITGGGWKGLDLRKEPYAAEYPDRMLKVTQAAKLSCTSDKIIVREHEKTCVNFENESGRLEVVCNIDRFMVQTQEAKQYPLVHHEFAVPAGFEQSQDGTSNYDVSDQLTGFLENQVVKKLAIKPSHLNEVTTKRSDGLELGNYKLIPTDQNTEYCDNLKPRTCIPAPDFAQIVAVTLAGEPDYGRFLQEELFRIVFHLKNGEQKEVEFTRDGLKFVGQDADGNIYYVRLNPEESTSGSATSIRGGNCFYSPWLRLTIVESRYNKPTNFNGKTMILHYGLRAFCK